MKFLFCYCFSAALVTSILNILIMTSSKNPNEKFGTAFNLVLVSLPTLLYFILT